MTCGKDGKRVGKVNNTKMDRRAREGSSAYLPFLETRFNVVHRDQQLHPLYTELNDTLFVIL
jgi:hypothetical protein